MRWGLPRSMVARGARGGVRRVSAAGRGEVGKTWDWSSYANMFTEDATYVEHALGDMTGRERSGWIVDQMNIFPGSEMPRLSR